jgi:hypothetical protein
MRGLLTRQFGNFFVQADDNDPDLTVPGAGAASRFEMRTGTTLDELYGWLRKHSVPPAAPAPAAAPAATPAPAPKAKAKGQRPHTLSKKTKR